MAFIREKRCPARHRLQNPRLAFFSQPRLKATVLGYQAYERLRFVRIQLVYDEDPARLRVAGNHRFNVLGKVLLRPRRPNLGGDDLSGGHHKTGNQCLGAMPDVLEFAQRGLALDHRARLVLRFQGLNARFLIGRGEIDARLQEALGRQVERADEADLGIESLGVLGAFIIEPVAPLMGLEVGFFLKSAPQSGAKSSRRGHVFRLRRPVRAASTG